MKEGLNQFARKLAELYGIEVIDGRGKSTVERADGSVVPFEQADFSDFIPVVKEREIDYSPFARISTNSHIHLFKVFRVEPKAQYYRERSNWPSEFEEDLCAAY